MTTSGVWCLVDGIVLETCAQDSKIRRLHLSFIINPLGWRVNTAPCDDRIITTGWDQSKSCEKYEQASAWTGIR